ncbi:unnamed protein product, partial [Amoebophrya sp. A120]
MVHSERRIHEEVEFFCFAVLCFLVEFVLPEKFYLHDLFGLRVESRTFGTIAVGRLRKLHRVMHSNWEQEVAVQAAPAQGKTTKTPGGSDTTSDSKAPETSNPEQQNMQGVPRVQVGPPFPSGCAWARGITLSRTGKVEVVVPATATAQERQNDAPSTSSGSGTSGTAVPAKPQKSRIDDLGHIHGSVVAEIFPTELHSQSKTTSYINRIS